MLKKRQEYIYGKGFEEESVDFAKMRVGLRQIDNALLNLNSYKKVSPQYGDKVFVLNAIAQKDYATLRNISNYFFESSGIYYNLCNYLAKLYRYDWYVTTFVIDEDKTKEKKILNDFSQVLFYLDNSQIKLLCENIALDIIVEGAYYGMILDFGDKFGMQKLPPEYCRQRFTSGTMPVVELNLRFFDSYFPNIQYKLKVLKMFPKEIQQAYVLYKEGKLQGDYPGDKSCWYPLEPGSCVCLTLNNRQFPTLVGVIPSIIDLDEAQGLDRQKTMQQLLKILVQKLPLDKNGDLIFDMDEAKDIHNNAVAMLKRAIGVDVLTTFADIEKIDTKDNNSETSKDDLAKVERTVFNNSGITKNVFNAEGNLAMTNSILADESSIRNIPLQFAAMLNTAINKFNTKKQYKFRVEMLETTQYNYRDLSKMFKEQTQMGFSKVLPAIALGQSQSSILATFIFENEILHLAEIMIPPMTSNTMSGKLVKNDQETQNKTQKQQIEEKTMGRPKKDDSEKSEKTIQNQESEG